MAVSLPTIHDIARQAQVSAMTVSRALNNRPGVSEDTRQKVHAVAQSLGYVANVQAKRLAGGQTNVLGMLVPDIGTEYVGEIVRGVGDALEKSGYDLLLYTTHRDPERERARLSGVAGGMADGLLTVLPKTIDSHLSMLEQLALPVVIVDHRGANTSLPTIGTDNLTGSREAVQHLAGLGHRRIGFITGDLSTGAAVDRLRGYREGLQAAGLPFDEALVGQGDFYQPRGFEAALELLRLPDAPTALFASNDVSAFGALAAVRELRLRVPTDVSVVGFDDIPSARQIHPPLTTVRQPLYEMGAAATRLLLSLLRGGEAAVPRISLPTVLVVRESTAPAKGGRHQPKPN